MKIKTRCRVCNKEFLTTSSRLKNGGSKFCSRQCSGIWRSKNVVGRNHPSWRGGGIKRICKVCGRRFDVRRARFSASRGAGSFCSNKCRGIAWRGEKSPVWKGGIASFARIIRAQTKYGFWRQEVFIRDRFSCQKCGEVGGILQAHHKNPFFKLLREAKEYLPFFSPYDSAMLYTPLWDIDNGITLCIKCHRKLSKKEETL